MSAGGILLTFVSICIGASLIIALLFRFWPRYGSVTEAVVRTDQLIEEMEGGTSEH